MVVKYRDTSYKRTIKELYDKYYGGQLHKEIVVKHPNGHVRISTKRELVSELKKWNAKYAFALPYGDLVLYIKAYQEGNDEAVKVFAERGKMLYLKYNGKK